MRGLQRGHRTRGKACSSACAVRVQRAPGYLHVCYCALAGAQRTRGISSFDIFVVHSSLRNRALFVFHVPCSYHVSSPRARRPFWGRRFLGTSGAGGGGRRVESTCATAVWGRVFLGASGAVGGTRLSPHARSDCRLVSRGRTTTKKPSGSTARPNRLHTHTHSPKSLAHPRSPIPPLSTLTARATHARPLHVHFTPQHWLL